MISVADMVCLLEAIPLPPDMAVRVHSEDKE